MNIAVTWHHATPRPGRTPTIWESLATKLGREPTDAEACAEVRRILTDGLIEAAGAGNLPHQRKGRKAAR